jgi:hypothetical protein
LNPIDENMLGDDNSLKAKIEKERTLFNKKKSFKEKKEAIKEFFKSNVKSMLKDRKVRISIEEREELNVLERKFFRELRYERNIHY